MPKDIPVIIYNYYHLYKLETKIGVRIEYMLRLICGDYTKTENPGNHFCIYFLPYKISEKKVFLVHHKKSGLWISPGGHIDWKEKPTESLKRECWEELGIELYDNHNFVPFLLTITKIPERPNSTCRKHFDIWYVIETDGINFNVDMNEFYDFGWFTISDARNIVIDESNIEALDRMEEFFNKVP